MTQNKIYKTYDEFESAQGLSPSSPESYYAEMAWNAGRDAMLARCDDPECYHCGAMVCPRGEPLHFHHDGCPSCCRFEDDV